MNDYLPSDADMINWIEQSRAQVLYDVVNGIWRIYDIWSGNEIHRGSTWRAAVEAAMQKEKTS